MSGARTAGPSSQARPKGQYMRPLRMFTVHSKVASVGVSMTLLGRPRNNKRRQYLINYESGWICSLSNEVSSCDWTTQRQKHGRHGGSHGDKTQGPTAAEAPAVAVGRAHTSAWCKLVQFPVHFGHAKTGMLHLSIINSTMSPSSESVFCTCIILPLPYVGTLGTRYLC